MNILFVSDFFPPYIYGGAEVSTSLLVQGLQKEHQCTVITSKVAAKEWNWRSVSVIPILKRPDLGSKHLVNIIGFGFSKITSPPINSIRLLKNLKKTAFDVIDFVATSNSLLPVIVLVSIIRKENIVIDVRDVSMVCVNDLSYPGYKETSRKHSCLRHLFIMYTHENRVVRLLMPLFGMYEIGVFKLYTFMLKQRIKHSKNIQIVALSDYVKDKLIQNGFASNKVSVIYNIARLEPIKSKADVKFKYDLVHAGRLDKRKGVWDLLHAYESLNQPTLKLAIAGTGTEFEALRKYVKKQHLNNITLLGRLSPDDIIKLYSKSRFIVAPVKSPEGFGRFIQESMTTGTPVIATAWGGIPEGIFDCKTGFLVKPNDPDGLVTVLKLATSMSAKEWFEMRSAIINYRDRFSETNILRLRMEVYGQSS